MFTTVDGPGVAAASSVSVAFSASKAERQSAFCTNKGRAPQGSDRHEIDIL